MRMFWGGRLKDFTVDEIEAFYNNLPPNSATIRHLSQSTVDTNEQMLALIYDNISGMRYGMAGKRLPDNKLLSTKLKVEKSSPKVQEMINKIKREKKQKQGEKNGMVSRRG